MTPELSVWCDQHRLSGGSGNPAYQKFLESVPHCPKTPDWCHVLAAFADGAAHEREKLSEAVKEVVVRALARSEEADNDEEFFAAQGKADGAEEVEAAIRARTKTEEVTSRQ